jgi:D-3-phosphoglycerate dehydrogenase
MRVLVAEPLAPEGVELLRAQHEVDERPGLSRDELCGSIGDYDALVVRSQVNVDAELIAAGRRLVVVGRAGVGVDNVDLDAATRAGITVVNAPTGAGSGSAASSPASSCAARRSASSGSARSARPSRTVPGRSRCGSWARIHT